MEFVKHKFHLIHIFYNFTSINVDLRGLETYLQVKVLDSVILSVKYSHVLSWRLKPKFYLIE